MKNSISETKSCCCDTEKQNCTTEKSISKTRKTLKAIPSMFLSVLIVFFPKCPACWAVYMSMFGSLGLVQLPYMGWLLPVLMLFLGIHLFLIYKKSAPNNYLPFLLSLTGTIIILVARFSFTNEKWLPIVGMLLLILGSLFIRFPAIQIPFFTPKNNII
jgi:hypothetical protein